MDPVTALREAYYRVLDRGRRRSKLVGEATVTIDEIIDEMHANTVGPDRPPEFYDQMRRAVAFQTDETGGRFQPFLDSVSAEIQHKLKERKVGLPLAVFVGQFPHGSFNAQGRMDKAGVLILINSGLFMFMYQMIKIATLATRFTDLDAGGRLIEHPDLHDVLITQEQITCSLTDVVLAYIENDDSTRAPRLPAFGGVRGSLLMGIVRACETFAVAHEFGHVIQGDFNDEQPALETGTVDFVRKTHLQEINADQVAVALMIAGLEDELVARAPDGTLNEIDRADLRVRAWTTMSGPFVFFALSDLIERVRRRVSALPTDEPPETSTHPPPEERDFQAREFVKRNGDFDLSVADTYVSFFAEQVDRIVAEVERRTA